MTTKELIKKIKKADPEGKAHVGFGGDKILKAVTKKSVGKDTVILFDLIGHKIKATEVQEIVTFDCIPGFETIAFCLNNEWNPELAEELMVMYTSPVIRNMLLDRIKDYMSDPIEVPQEVKKRIVGNGLVEEKLGATKSKIILLK